MRWLVCLVVLTGCARDVAVRYPSSPAEPVGTLVLKMGAPASGVTVAVDGILVVDGAHTERVQIDGVPVGTREVVLAANGADKAMRVWVGSDHPTTVPIGVPDGGIGFVKSVLGSVIGLVVYSLLH